MHGHELDGNHVRVEYSISNREHNPTPGVIILIWFKWIKYYLFFLNISSYLRYIWVEEQLQVDIIAMMIIIAAETEHVIHQNPDQDLMKEVLKK